MKRSVLLSLAAVAVLLSSGQASAQPVGRIIGLGGVFVRSKDFKALAAWYRDMLGLEVKPWGGAILKYDPAQHAPYTLWSAFGEKSEEMAGAAQNYSINFVVDDMEAFVTRLDAKGVKILKREEDQTGKFVWILDPEGAKIEFWQPKPS